MIAMSIVYKFHLFTSVSRSLRATERTVLVVLEGFFIPVRDFNFDLVTTRILALHMGHLLLGYQDPPAAIHKYRARQLIISDRKCHT